MGLLFDSGFDVIAGFISRFDVLDFNFVLIFFNLIKINLDADVAFFDVKIDFFNYYFNVPLATSVISVCWLTERTKITNVNWIRD